MVISTLRGENCNGKLVCGRGECGTGTKQLARAVKKAKARSSVRNTGTAFLTVRSYATYY